jgi:hypothetical protein
VLCPDFSSGPNVPSGCRCHPYYVGNVTATSVAPFFISTCSPIELPCPANSTGTSVYAGCTCLAGFRGNVTLLPVFPFVSSTCTPEPCPATTVGVNLVTGCACPSGTMGSVVPTTVPPFAIVSCLPTPVWTTTALPTLFDLDRSRGVTLRVTATLNPTFSLSSGSLPAGATLSAAGILSGFSAVAADTVSSFAIRATTGSVWSERAFTLTVKAPVVQIYGFTGADVPFAIPAGMQFLRAVLWGAAGGGATGEGFSDAGGVGGFTEGIVNVTNLGGTNLILQVGAGGACSGPRPANRAYPNGGFAPSRSGYNNGGGGGRTAIFRASVAFANALLVAGGGGGAAGHGGGNTGRGSQGGSGGGLTSESGVSSFQTSAVNSATQTMTNNMPVFGTPPQQGGQLAGQDAGSSLTFDAGGNNCAGEALIRLFGFVAGLACVPTLACPSFRRLFFCHALEGADPCRRRR